MIYAIVMTIIALPIGILALSASKRWDGFFIILLMGIIWGLVLHWYKGKF